MGMGKIVRLLASALAGRERSRMVDSFWKPLGLSLMKGVAERLSQALHIRDIAGQDSNDRFVDGPMNLLHRSNPLVDDFGNLLWPSFALHRAIRRFSRAILARDKDRGYRYRSENRRTTLGGSYSAYLPSRASNPQFAGAWITRSSSPNYRCC